MSTSIVCPFPDCNSGFVGGARDTDSERLRHRNMFSYYFFVTSSHFYHHLFPSFTFKLPKLDAPNFYAPLLHKLSQLFSPNTAKITPHPYITCKHHPDYRKPSFLSIFSKKRAENGKIKRLCTCLCPPSTSRTGQKRAFTKRTLKEQEKATYCNLAATCSTSSTTVASTSLFNESCLIEALINMKLISASDTSGSTTVFNKILRTNLLKVRGF